MAIPYRLPLPPPQQPEATTPTTPGTGGTGGVLDYFQLPWLSGFQNQPGTGTGTGPHFPTGSRTPRWNFEQFLANVPDWLKKIWQDAMTPNGGGETPAPAPAPVAENTPRPASDLNDFARNFPALADLRQRGFVRPPGTTMHNVEAPAGTNLIEGSGAVRPSSSGSGFSFVNLLGGRY